MITRQSASALGLELASTGKNFQTMQPEAARLRIMHVIDSGGLYGAEKMILSLSLECKKMGHEIFIGTIVSPDDLGDPLGEIAAGHTLNHICFRMPDGFSIRGLWEILRFARAQKIDVIHSHGYKSNIILGITPRLVRPSPIICTLHGWTSRAHLKKLTFFEAVERKLIRRLDSIVSVSDSVRRKIDPERSNKKISTIPNGIQLPQELPITPSRPLVGRGWSEHEPLRILSIGRLSHEKGFDTLLEAVRILREQDAHIRVTIAGDGPRRHELLQFVEAANLEQYVSLIGYVRDTQALYEAADLFVIPSRTEGLPLVLLEAMIARVPVIATDVGDISQVLAGGRYGRLLRKPDARVLADAILDFSSNRLQVIEETVDKARQNVIEAYSAEMMAKRYVEVYRSCIDDGDVS